MVRLLAGGCSRHRCVPSLSRSINGVSMPTPSTLIKACVSSVTSTSLPYSTRAYRVVATLKYRRSGAWLVSETLNGDPLTQLKNCQPGAVEERVKGGGGVALWVWKRAFWYPFQLSAHGNQYINKRTLFTKRHPEWQIHFIQLVLILKSCQSPISAGEKKCCVHMVRWRVLSKVFFETWNNSINWRLKRAEKIHARNIRFTITVAKFSMGFNIQKQLMTHTLNHLYQ